MANKPSSSGLAARSVGRPRRGTESARTDELINAATRVFLRDGFGMASMDKVAAEAAVSTRTIYERYENKGALLTAVIKRLVDRMAKVVATAELERLATREALMRIARAVTERAGDPDSGALFRIVATEAHRFPELAAQMRASDKRHVDSAIAEYFRHEMKRGNLVLQNPEKAAALFLHMVFAQLHERWLFGDEQAPPQADLDSYLEFVIDIFLSGTAPREASTAAPA